MLLERLKL